MNIEFEQLENNLDDGYEILLEYDKKQYLLFKTGENCYTLNLLTILPKNPHPVKQLITHKRLKEMYPFMNNIEYRVKL